MAVTHSGGEECSLLYSPSSCSKVRNGRGWGVADDLFTLGDPVMQDQEHWLFDRGQFKPKL